MNKMNHKTIYISTTLLVIVFVTNFDFLHAIDEQVCIFIAKKPYLAPY